MIVTVSIRQESGPSSEQSITHSSSLPEDTVNALRHNTAGALAEVTEIALSRGWISG